MAVACLCEAEDQLSLAKHAQDVQGALSTKHITILIPTIHSKLDPKSSSSRAHQPFLHEQPR